ncbi:MAG TPA: sialidase family protein [Chitinophagaceae bacterium]|nr:sialidase family protein [Chitinophagaceae bacterium]
MKKIVVFICLSALLAPGLSAQNLPVGKRRSPGQGRISARDITMGPRFVIDSSADSTERQFPFAYKFGSNVLVSYSEHKDAVIAAPVDAMMISRDNGNTWKEKLTNKDFYISSMVEKNGILYGVVYFTYPVSSGQERMVYWTSGDMGRSWKKHEGVVNAPKGRKFKANGITGIWGSMLFHRGMQVMEDGSIQGVMYGYFAGEDKYSVVWVRSNDNCATWNVVSVVASGLPEGNFKNAEGYCEPTFAKTRDGSLLCVMRISSYLPLYQCRSSDNGKNWSRPIPLPGLADTASESVDPQLVLMKNGVLALTYGRPGDRMAFSGDGCGYHWDSSLPTYEKETTGYTTMVEAGPGKLLLISDQGRTGARQIAIWGRFISVAPGNSRIRL